jgi:anthranilate phosphoribosyltransferase
VRTVFNVLGPLCNPARATQHALGAADGALAPTLAEVLARLGATRVLVFHGEDGMDELTTTAPSRVIECFDGRRAEYELTPSELGLRQASVESIRGGSAPENAQIAREILSGGGGPRRDVVLLNSAAALRAAGLAHGWREGIGFAAEAIDSGRAGEVLENWARVSHAVA